MLVFSLLIVTFAYENHVGCLTISEQKVLVIRNIYLNRHRINFHSMRSTSYLLKHASYPNPRVRCRLLYLLDSYMHLLGLKMRLRE